MREHLYLPPEGMVDIPFIYAFDCRELTPATNVPNLVIPIQGEDFIARSVVGMHTAAQTWMYYNPSRAEAMNAPTPTNQRWTIVPEKFYPMRSEFRFDLGTIAPQTNYWGNSVAFLGVQGVKRVGKGQFGWTDYKTEYQYWERPYTYNLDLTIDFHADTGSAPRTYDIPITNADFELMSITVRRTDVDEPIGADPFLVRLFDPSGYDGLMTGYIPVRWLDANQGPTWSSIFPAPTLVYPLNGRIRLSIDSLVDTPDTPSYQIAFHGVERAPCVG